MYKHHLLVTLKYLPNASVYTKKTMTGAYRRICKVYYHYQTKRKKQHFWYLYILRSLFKLLE